MTTFSILINGVHDNIVVVGVFCSDHLLSGGRGSGRSSCGSLHCTRVIVYVYIIRILRSFLKKIYLIMLL